jgi:hypothetical protein
MASAATLGELKVAAEKGDPAAQEEYADRSIGVSGGKEAEKYYRRAAASGRATAQAKLGHQLFSRYQMGFGMKQADRNAVGKESLIWLKKGSEQGVALAQADYAKVHLEGKLVRKDLVEAYKWGALAAKSLGFGLERVAGQVVRDLAVREMTAVQIADGDRRVASFRPGAGRGSPAVDPALRLRGVVGSGKKRLALINGKTLSQGEGATLDLPGGRTTIRCVRIGQDWAEVIVGKSGRVQRLELEP